MTADLRSLQINTDETQDSRSASSDNPSCRYIIDVQRHSTETVLAKMSSALSALFTGVDSESPKKATFARKMSRNAATRPTRRSRQVRKMASYWLIMSLTRGQPAANRRPPTTGRRDKQRRSETVTRRRRSTIDDVEQFQQQQQQLATWSIKQGEVAAKPRRRPPLATERDTQGEPEDSMHPARNATQIGHSEITVTSLLHKISKDNGHKYFVGKRHPVHSGGRVSSWSWAEVKQKIFARM